MAIISGDYAWNLDVEETVPQYLAAGRGCEVPANRHQSDTLRFPESGAGRQPDRLLDHAAPGRTTWKGKATLVSSTAMGKYRVNGTFNAQKVLDLVQTWVANPVSGDIPYELSYTEYTDCGGVKFPTRVAHSSG